MPDILNHNSGNVTFRSYNSCDAQKLCDIYSYYVKNSVVTFDLKAPDVEQIDKKFSALGTANHPLLIAWSKKEIIGYAYASTYRPRPAYRFTCENAIYLAHDRQGEGTGSLMMAELIRQSKQFGFNQMVAIITSSAENSISLHKKHGFEILGQFPELGYKFDTWHNVTHMQKKL